MAIESEWFDFRAVYIPWEKKISFSSFFFALLKVSTLSPTLKWNTKGSFLCFATIFEWKIILQKYVLMTSLLICVRANVYKIDHYIRFVVDFTVRLHARAFPYHHRISDSHQWYNNIYIRCVVHTCIYLKYKSVFNMRVWFHALIGYTIHSTTTHKKYVHQLNFVHKGRNF